MEPKGLKVLMISRDRNILSPNSPAQGRMKDYGKLVTELHIVLLSRKSEGLQEQEISKNVWVYPTNSSSKWLYTSGAAKLGKKIILDKKFVRGESVITAQDAYECGWAGLKVKQKWRIPLEIQIHADDAINTYSSDFLNKLRNKIAERVIKSADSIRVVHNFLKGQIIQKFKIDPRKVFVLPIYIDKGPIENGQITFDVHARYGWSFIILMVARLVPQKDIGTAIDVLAGVCQRFPNTGLVIVGEGPDKAKLESLADKRGVGKNIIFAGWQSDLASFYRTSNIFLQTSIYEGYGMALVEAGLSGLPVVTTPVGIALELTNDKDAYICPPGNTEYFTDAIVDLIQNNQKRENLKLNMKRTLDGMLIPKEFFFSSVKNEWEKASKKVN